MVVGEYPVQATTTLARVVGEHWQRLSQLLAEELGARGLPALGAQLTPDTGRMPEILRLYVAIAEGSDADELPDAAAWAALAAGLRGERVEELVHALGIAVRRLLEELGVEDQDVRRCATHVAEAMGWQLRDAESHLLGEEARAALELLERAQSPAAKPVLLVELPNLTIAWAHPAIASVSGRTPRQLRGASLAEILPEFVEAHREELVKLSDGQVPLEGSTVISRPDGGTVPARVAAARATLDGRAYLVLSLEDTSRWAALASRLAGVALELQQQVQEQARELRGRHSFLVQLLDALPLRVLVLDSDLRIILANRAYYEQRGVTLAELIGRPIDDIFPAELLDGAGLRRILLDVLEKREPVTWRGYRSSTPDHAARVVNMRVDPCTAPGGQPCVVLSIEDVTWQQRRAYEQSVLQQIMQAMLVAQDLPRLLHAILTAVTAGGACGLGLNRAFLLLVDEEKNVLSGALAVGPATREEAYCIWSEVGERYQTIEDFMRDYDKLPPPEQRPLAGVLREMVFDLSQTEQLPVMALASGEIIHVTDAANDPRVPKKLHELLGVSEFVVAPMRASDKPIGVAIADNFVTLDPISDESIVLLSMVSNLAALAIDAARARERERQQAEELRRAYEELERGEQELVRSKQLAAIGEMSAIVAHEIRNALVPIGGFARRIARRNPDPEETKRSAEIIYREVQRLERILNELLDATRPRQPKLEPTEVGPLLEEVAEMMRQRPDAERVAIEVEVQRDMPQLLMDREMMKQVLINLAQNGIEAMQETGGTLRLAAKREGSGAVIEVSDTGPGIPPERIATIWDTFLTTKPSGTGLGLGLSKAIVARHRASLDVCSQVGHGTMFTIRFPAESCVEPGQNKAFASAASDN
ncbi:MAG: PAS domain-containing protein [Armatimonadetes bacterium]|nr:PAS domain-containing protein [Armatimonadota bacterium]